MGFLSICLSNIMAKNWVVLFKGHLFDTTRGVWVVHPHGLANVTHGSTLASSNVFILAFKPNKCITWHIYLSTNTKPNGG